MEGPNPAEERKLADGEQRDDRGRHHEEDRPAEVAEPRAAPPSGLSGVSLQPFEWLCL